MRHANEWVVYQQSAAQTGVGSEVDFWGAHVSGTSFNLCVQPP